MMMLLLHDPAFWQGFVAGFVAFLIIIVITVAFMPPPTYRG